MTTYDPNNIFARILRKEVPVKIIDEDQYSLAFHDAFPKAKVHVLVIPKGEYISFQDFSTKASDKEVLSLIQMTGKVADKLGIKDSGYRILSNHGSDGGQEVPHFHVHICGGEPLGPLLGS